MQGDKTWRACERWKEWKRSVCHVSVTTTSCPLIIFYNLSDVMLCHIYYYFIDLLNLWVVSVFAVMRIRGMFFQLRLLPSPDGHWHFGASPVRLFVSETQRNPGGYNWILTRRVRLTSFILKNIKIKGKNYDLFFLWAHHISIKEGSDNR